MTKYFTIIELTRSSVAEEQGIENFPSKEVVARLEMLMKMLLDPVREMWGSHIWVTSGYRCPALNKAVGGAASSGHLRGEAADITTGSRKYNRQLFEMIVEQADAGELEFDQLIDERDYSWLHISYRAGANRRQILHL